MSKSSAVLKAIKYSFGVSIIASLAVLLVGACLFGFSLSHWAEWEGRLVGVIGVMAGVAGAVVGLRMALGVEWRRQ